MAALYIDNHAKEVWSSLFTRSGEASHLNRVMPCITTTYAHTAAGHATRVLITPLKPSRMSELELCNTRGAYYLPTREHDELRVANATLVHRSSGRSLEVGALLLRRAHRKHETVLLTTGIALGMQGSDLADLYCARWPLQEKVPV